MQFLFVAPLIVSAATLVVLIFRKDCGHGW